MDWFKFHQPNQHSASGCEGYFNCFDKQRLCSKLTEIWLLVSIFRLIKCWSQSWLTTNKWRMKGWGEGVPMAGFSYQKAATYWRWEVVSHTRYGTVKRSSWSNLWSWYPMYVLPNLTSIWCHLNYSVFSLF